MKQKKITVKQVAMIGVLSALVFAGSMIQIPIPTAVDNTRLHLGNVMCLLSGLLLGPVPGGLAAGFGSLFFDLTNPLFIADAPITFLTKFLMAFACGKIAWGGGSSARSFPRNMIAAASGALLYVALYLLKTFLQNYVFLGMELPTVLITMGQKGVVSGINGVIATIAAVPLAAALRAALERAHLDVQPSGR